MYLGAWLLLPAGFDEHPDAHYPAHRLPRPLPRRHSSLQQQARAQTRRPAAARRRRTRPRPTSSTRTGPTAPSLTSPPLRPERQPLLRRLLRRRLRQRRPLRLGHQRRTDPRRREAIPRHRPGLGPRHLRRSTGGWESLATQIFYPDSYNGVWSACPDPVDFHAYQNINLYDDPNAFDRLGDFGKFPSAATANPTARSPPPPKASSASSTSSARTRARPSNGRSGRPSSRPSAPTATPPTSSTHSPARSTPRS